jgi:hypothetical protein
VSIYSLTEEVKILPHYYDRPREVPGKPRLPERGTLRRPTEDRDIRIGKRPKRKEDGLFGVIPFTSGKKKIKFLEVLSKICR